MTTGGAYNQFSFKLQIPLYRSFANDGFTGVRGELLLGGRVVDVRDTDADDWCRAHADQHAGDDEDGQIQRQRGAAGVQITVTHERFVIRAEAVHSQPVRRSVVWSRELRQRERHAAQTDRQ